MKHKRKLRLPHGHRPIAFNGNIDYSHKIAPETEDSFDQDAFVELCKDVEMPEETIAIIEKWVDEQIRLGMREFIYKFTNKMSHSLHGFCVLRALGYHAHIEDQEGKPITSLRAIAKHFECSHQYVDKLTKDLEVQLGLKIENLQIEQKTYSMEVTPPEGWITIGQALKKYDLTRKVLWDIINQEGLRVRDYTRQSKIIKDDTLQDVLRQEIYYKIKV
jgi:hypothetical protein